MAGSYSGHRALWEEGACALSVSPLMWTAQLPWLAWHSLGSLASLSGYACSCPSAHLYILGSIRTEQDKPKQQVPGKVTRLPYLDLQGFKRMGEDGSPGERHNVGEVSSQRTRKESSVWHGCQGRSVATSKAELRLSS